MFQRQVSVAKRRPRNRPIVTPVSRPAPIGGWNTRDALDAMDEKDAVTLDNWIPGTSSVKVRNGYALHSDASKTAATKTLVEYHAGAVQKLIGAADGELIDFSTASPSSLKTGLTSDEWDTENFNGRLVLVNGADDPHDYDGSTVTTPAWTGSGLTIADLDGVMAHRARLYFWDSSKQSFWYGGVNAVSGTLTEFPLSRVAQFGGNLVAAGSWTVDTGEGINDLAVFVMSSGQTIVYAGSDPGDANNWSLVGVYNVGRPINKRGLVRVGGDLMITTYDDYISLKDVLSKGYIGASSALSGALQEQAATNGGSFGWQSVLYPTGGLLLFNVPIAGSNYVQHVINTTTGAACRFTGIKAHCWAAMGNALYFGGDDGTVYEYTGEDDSGAQIPAIAQPAWTALGKPSTKAIKAMQPVIGFTGDIAYEIGVGYDFMSASVSSPSTAVDNAQPWGSITWSSWQWGGSEVISTSWQVASGKGQVVSPVLRINAKTAVTWYQINYRIEQGDML